MKVVDIREKNPELYLNIFTQSTGFKAMLTQQNPFDCLVTYTFPVQQLSLQPGRGIEKDGESEGQKPRFKVQL